MKSSALRVSELPFTDQPLARVREHGPEALTSGELLTAALGLQSVNHGEMIFAKAGGNWKALERATVFQTGLPVKKQSQLDAVMEIGRRVRMASEDRIAVRSPRDVWNYASPFLEHLTVEEFHVLAIDAKHRLVRDITMSVGILDSSLVHPREVFKAAVAESACSIILVHNHPSGDPAPSADDIAVTNQLVSAGKIMEIPVHDHVIIGHGSYKSLSEMGII